MVSLSNMENLVIKDFGLLKLVPYYKLQLLYPTKGRLHLTLGFSKRKTSNIGPG